MSIPNYYELLGVSKNATQEEIKTAYKREALKTHPDRLGKESSKQKFQQVSEAYFVLSDPLKRKEYDEKLNLNFSSKKDFNFEQFSFYDYFKSLIPDQLFFSVFEDLIGEELHCGEAQGWMGWPSIGMISGAGMGLIIGNVPGAVIGGVAGFKLGQVRTKTGKSIYESWTVISSEQKSKIFVNLASKIL